MRHSKTCAFWIISSLLTYVVVEGVAYTGYMALSRINSVWFTPVDELEADHIDTIRRLLDGDVEYTSYSQSLGWTIQPGAKVELYRSNSDGFRANKDYTAAPPAGVLRIATFGDSFTHGSDVAIQHTWQSRMEKIDSKLEVLNFGVGGYGPDQAYLRYQHYRGRYEAHIVLIGYMSENIHRIVNVFRPFYERRTRLPLAKPRFIVANDKLELISNPAQTLDSYRQLLSAPSQTLREWGTHDYFWQSGYTSKLGFSPTIRLTKMLWHELSTTDIVKNGKYNEQSPAFTLLTKIMDSFYYAALEDGAVPVVVIFPLRRELPKVGEEPDTTYEPLLRYLRDKGYQYIDILDAFKLNGGGYVAREEVFDIHFNELGNSLAARHIYSQLRDRGLLQSANSIAASSAAECLRLGCVRPSGFRPDAPS